MNKKTLRTIIKKGCFVVIIAFIFTGCNSQKQIEFDSNPAIEQAAEQYANFYQKSYHRLQKKRFLPRTTENHKVKYVGMYDWTSGFYPGSLWYLSQLTKDDSWKQRALTYTLKMDSVKYYTGNHDIGFMMGSSYGNALKFSPDDSYKEVLIQSAKSLSSRYNPNIGLIKSWDWSSKWDYPVIVDNMMNLELLFLASELSGDQTYRDIAVNHAINTDKYHFREDGSSYHVLDYNSETGAVINKVTHQGLADESAWARGQAWGLYGFTMCYRETKNVVFLNRATQIAEFIMNHPELPEDHVPYWDFDVEKTPDTPRDASAAAITASALIELSEFVDVEQSEAFMNEARNILSSLSSDNYLAKVNTNNGFILKHSVGSLPGNVEVDVPLNYADYYYLEALYRLQLK